MKEEGEREWGEWMGEVREKRGRERGRERERERLE